MQTFKTVGAVVLGAATFASTMGTSLAPRTVFQPPVSSGCSNTGPASCTNTSVVADTCCFEANGQLLQVQFWDTGALSFFLAHTQQLIQCS
jgi:ribonuclease T2